MKSTFVNHCKDANLAYNKGMQSDQQTAARFADR
jgi:hypothetical protein